MIFNRTNAGKRITLRPVGGGAAFAKERGVWVFRTSQPLAASVTDHLLEHIRKQREKQNLTAPNEGVVR